MTVPDHVTIYSQRPELPKALLPPLVHLSGSGTGIFHPEPFGLFDALSPSPQVILLDVANNMPQVQLEALVHTMKTKFHEIDCMATNALGTEEPLRIQVVRAIVDTEIWKAVAESGLLEKSNVAVEELAQMMADALQKKLDPRKIPLKQREALVLALDATRLPALAFDSVVSSFQERHGGAVKGTGFRSVWIVGPTESLSKRLDVSRAP